MPVQIVFDDGDDASPAAEAAVASLPANLRVGNPFSFNSSVTAMVRRGLSRVDEHDRDGRLYASQAAVCQRQAVLSSTRQDLSVVTPANAAYFALGNTIEDLVLNALMRDGTLLFSQYRLPDVGLNLGGYIDGVVVVNGRIRVLEVKSTSDLPNEPKLEHRAQAMVYSAITGLPPTVFYFSRHVANFDGTLKVREFALTPTLDDVRATLFKVIYSRLAIDADVIPDRPMEFVDERDCGHCPWKSMCWHGEALPRDPVTPDQHRSLVREARRRVNELTTQESILHRRNGVLSHLARHGTEHAKTVLAGDWSKLVDEHPLAED